MEFLIEFLSISLCRHGKVCKWKWIQIDSLLNQKEAKDKSLLVLLTTVFGKSEILYTKYTIDWTTKEREKGKKKRTTWIGKRLLERKMVEDIKIKEKSLWWKGKRKFIMKTSGQKHKFVYKYTSLQQKNLYLY